MSHTMPDYSSFTQSIVSVAARILGVNPEILFGRAFAELGKSSLDASRLVVALMHETGLRLRAVEVMSTDDIGSFLASLPAHSLPATPPDDGLSIHPGDKIPLTWQQKIVWFQEALDPGSPKYYFHATLQFDSKPDVTLLYKRLTAALRQHPVMRIRLEYTRRGVVQIVPAQEISSLDIDFQEITLTSAPPTRRALVEVVDGNSPFDLSKGPLVRWRLIYLPGDVTVLLHTEHHLIHDGISFLSFLRSLDDANETREPDYGYFTYALAQRPAQEEEIARVAARLATADLSPFPSRGTIGDGPDLHVRVPVPGKLFRAIEDTAKRAKTSTFAAFLAANVHAVGKYRGTRSFTVATGTANRPLDNNDTVGMFVSMVPTLVQYDPVVVPTEHLRAVNEALQEAIARSDLPVQEITRAMGRAVRNGNSLITTGFSMLDQTCTSVKIAGQVATLYAGIFTNSAKFPLDAVLLLMGEGPNRKAELIFEGKSGSVGEDDIWAIWTMMIDWLKEFTGLVSPLPDASVSALVGHLVRHAVQQPDVPALVDDTLTISYSELLSFAERAMPILTGYRRIGIVGVASARFYAIAFAALYAGGAYVPLPEDQSVDRLAAMARAAACDLLIVAADNAAHQIVGSVQDYITGLPLATWQELSSASSNTIAPAPSAEAAYVIFTSGSTGVPSGVLVHRQGLDQMCEWAVQECSLSVGQPVGQWCGVGFDASALEVWPALWAGCSVHIVPQNIRSDPFELMAWLAASVRLVVVTGSIGNLLNQLDWPADCRLETLIVGGEPLHAVREGLPYRVMNGYGPTEATVIATFEWVTPGVDTLPPIGRSLPYVQIYLVTEGGQLVEEGMGELWIGGAAVARGYAQDPWKTAARFIPDPYSDDGRLLYRTGDIVHQDANGVLAFQGRRDRQVKVDGVRLELAEIEAVAMRQPGVQLAAAIMVGTRPLVCLLTEKGIDQTALMQAIHRDLPSQVRHLGVRIVPDLPVTTSGKIDLRELSHRVTSEGVIHG
jgi:amino acid adenylation domain-containing protein